MNVLLEVLAVFCHGIAATCNVFGVIYNFAIARRIDRDVAMHLAAGTYDVSSVTKHAKRLGKLREAR